MHWVYWIGHTASGLLARLFYSYRVYHPENLIEEGPALIVTNHTSFLDPPLVGIAFKKPIHYLARKTLLSNAVATYIYLRCNVVPVDQERADVTSLKTILRLLKGGERVLIFPEGSRSFDGELGPGEPGVGLLVAKSAVPVLPMRIFGAHEALPRGAKGPRRSRIRVVVGKPIQFTAEELANPARDKDHYRKISERIMTAIGELELPEAAS